MFQKHSRRSDPDRVAREATLWLSRRDRGLEPAEQDEFMQWLARDPSHAEALRQHAAAFERMMTLYEWQPGQSAEPNVELFSPRARRRWPRAAAILAAAAAVVFAAGIVVWSRGSRSAPVAITPASYLRVNERHALPDGSVVEVRDGSRITVRFSAEERRLVLVGEGHFTVARDATRPFVVEAGGATVRALGTAFNVRLGADAMEVLVTEGSVQVQPPGLVSGSGVDDGTTGLPAAAVVSARQRAVVRLSRAAAASVSSALESEMVETLAWKTPRLQFFETPLATAVAEFNRHNPIQIVLDDAELHALAIGGTFLVNNVEGFVRLLEVTLDLRAERRGQQIILTRAR